MFRTIGKHVQTKQTNIFTANGWSRMKVLANIEAKDMNRKRERRRGGKKRKGKKRKRRPRERDGKRREVARDGRWIWRMMRRVWGSKNPTPFLFHHLD